MAARSCDVLGITSRHAWVVIVWHRDRDAILRLTSNETRMPLLLVAIRQGLHGRASARLSRRYRSPVLDL